MSLLIFLQNGELKSNRRSFVTTSSRASVIEQDQTMWHSVHKLRIKRDVSRICFLTMEGKRCSITREQFTSDAVDGVDACVFAIFAEPGQLAGVTAQPIISDALDPLILDE